MDEVSLTGYCEAAANTIGKAFMPWSRISPVEWSENIYRLPKGGRFRFDFAPYTKRMFLSLFDKHTISTDFMLYSRGLKSTVILLAMGYLIDQAPRRILCLWPTNSQGERFSKDNLCGELLDTTPCLNYLGSQGNRRLSANTILLKHFPGGLINIFGANAPGDLRRSKGSFLYADEIDAIASEVTDEGDQLKIFERRGSEYPDTIQVFASYPSLLGHSRISSRLENSDFNEWHSTCAECGGEPFVMRRKMLRYEKEKPEGARLECPRCGALLTDSQRYDMAHKQGFDCWKPRHEFRGRRGFHGNAMLWPHPVDVKKYPGGFLQMLAEQEMEVEASADRKRALRPLVNTVDAEPFDPTDESEQPPDWKTLHERRENYDTVPQAASFITAFCDVQRNRLEVGWRAWNREEESWGLDHVVLDGYTSHQEVWAALTKELGREWTHASGAKLRLGMAFVDGGAYAEEVYRFFQRIAREPVQHVTGHVRASKGVGRFAAPIITRKMSTVAKNLKGHEIGTWEAKDRIYERLRVTEPGATAMHFNLRFSEEYFQQLTVEKVVITFDGGQEIRKYENEKNARNEALDIEVGCLAALRLHPRNWDALEQAIADEAEALRTPNAKPREEAPSVVVGGGFGGGWRI